jgi:uncharacterized protein YqeY
VPELAETLQAALTAARKAKDKDRTLLLGTVLASLKNREIELARDLTDPEVVEVLRKGVKTRRESVEQYTAGNRKDLADRETWEIGVIEAYLPPDADPAEIRAAVRAAVAAGATEIGKVMGKVMPQFKGRADGKVIQQIAREELTQG